MPILHLICGIVRALTKLNSKVILDSGDDFYDIEGEAKGAKHHEDYGVIKVPAGTLFRETSLTRD